MNRRSFLARAGAFPLFLGGYRAHQDQDFDVLVRGATSSSTEAALRKMTSLPAERFGLARRGRIAEGSFADVVVLDPARVRDRATCAEPHPSSRWALADSRRPDCLEIPRSRVHGANSDKAAVAADGVTPGLPTRRGSASSQI